MKEAPFTLDGSFSNSDECTLLHMCASRVLDVCGGAVGLLAVIISLSPCASTGIKLGGFIIRTL